MGGVLGTAIAHLMFESPLFSLSRHARAGPGQSLVLRASSARHRHRPTMGERIDGMKRPTQLDVVAYTAPPREHALTGTRGRGGASHGMDYVGIGLHKKDSRSVWAYATLP
jgi:hypothetical protein